MDITTTASKPSPEGTHPTKPIFFKRHAPPGGSAYKECLKNHAATMGGHALDGCGEFFPESTADPTSLTCGACGCHRNFHRRDPDSSSAPLIEYRPHHRHHPPPPSTMARGSHSPPPISSSYYPHMLLPLDRTGPETPNRKRFRTKFTQEQKEKMLEVGEKLGWKMQKINDDLVKKLCSEIGVERVVFKVWMHNNKNTLAKSFTGNENNNFQRESHRTGSGNGNGNSHSSSIEHQDHNGKGNGASANNVSSSS